MINDTIGWLIAVNVDISVLGEFKEHNGFSLFDKRNNKFPKDCIEADNCFLDGYVFNIPELKQKYSTDDWTEAFLLSYVANGSPSELRGGFCGFVRDTETDVLTLFTDHMSNRALYVWMQDDKLIFSPRLLLISKVLKANSLPCRINEQAVKYLCTCAYMLDNTSFIDGVVRLLPGQQITISARVAHKSTYYMPDNTHTEEMSMNEVVERLDTAFRNAVVREFEKDAEYGYRHLVDLSGGLDSRMVTWVAHDCGYKDQLNFTYCTANYLDMKISIQVSQYLRHEYLFMPLDDFRWALDCDDVISRNNAVAPYITITGANRFLRDVDKSCFGIEHTGMVGDAIVGTFFTSEEYTYGKAHFGDKQYSYKLNYDFPEEILRNYPNHEVFIMITRGLLGAASSYILRSTYLEASSPFIDVDFLNVCMSIPFKHRYDHRLYMRWINTKYPQAAEFGWEHCFGVKPRGNYKLMYNVKRVINKVWRILS